MTNKIEHFAKLICSIRDRAIESCDQNWRPSPRNIVAERWQSGPNTDALTPDTVDETLFFLLTAIDQGELRLTYTTDSGEIIDLTNEGLGELAGWYIGPEGWREQYSNKRYFAFTPTDGDSRE